TQKAANPKPATAATVPPAPTPVSAPAAASAAPPATAPAGQVSATAEQRYTINTDLFQVRFPNRCAVVQSWLLKKYPDEAGKALELVNMQPAAKIGDPFQFEFEHAPCTEH